MYWFLKEPATKDEIPRVEDALRRVARALDGDISAAEAARILRIPGTFNRKPEYGSPRPVELEYCNSNRKYKND